MAKLTLEKTLDTSLRDTTIYSGLGEAKPYLDYNRRIKLLGETGRLTVDHLLDLIDTSSENYSGLIEQVASGALSDPELFLPGVSSVVVKQNRIVGVYDNPNDHPVLNSYGPGLMWALLKIGQEAYASGVKSTGCLQPGYDHVARALEGCDYPRQKAARHHIGGSSTAVRVFPELPIGAKSGLETVGLYCGVSGLLATEQFRGFARSDHDLRPIAKEAEAKGALDGFAGNMFAGSLDSTLASRILAHICEDNDYLQDPYTKRAVADIVSRDAIGINVH